jgi:hypothetical protein
MTPQDCALLIGAVAGGVATCLAAIGALWLQVRSDHSALHGQLEQVAKAVDKPASSTVDSNPDASMG